MNLVDQYINDTFENCTITPAPMLPNGKTVTDATGALLLVYQDIRYNNRIIVEDTSDGFEQTMARVTAGWALVS